MSMDARSYLPDEVAAAARLGGETHSLARRACMAAALGHKKVSSPRKYDMSWLLAARVDSHHNPVPEINRLDPTSIKAELQVR